jgi:hypothetical protein
MFSGPSLNNGIRTALYLAARKLILSGKNCIRFKDEDGEGGVSTRHRRVVVASGMVGIEFSAVVEMNDRTTKCRFIVNDLKMPPESEILDGSYEWFTFDVTAPDRDDADWWKN